MEILDTLLVHSQWQSFLEYKISGGHMTKAEQEKLEKFIAEKEYVNSAEKLLFGGAFSHPRAVMINKSFSDKKRIVFTFPEEENYIQKMLAFQLLKYDYIFSDNLYSFRQNKGVKNAIKKLVSNKPSKLFSYKLDISDYFNSVDCSLLLPELKELLCEDMKLYSVIEAMLSSPYAIVDGELAEIKKGIIAGSPISGFLANLYVSALDKHFESIDAMYARYSDDIIVFAETETELNSYIEYIKSFLKSRRLTVNDSKVSITRPLEKWSFLGFSYENGVIDISDISKSKLKKKMRRKARALNRWRIKKSAAPERAAAAYIRYFNKKLFSNDVVNEITWSRWYFPIINTDKSLKELDSYMQQCVRFAATGKQNRGKFAFSYSDMKALGYVTLVNRYYCFKNNRLNTD